MKKLILILFIFTVLCPIATSVEFIYTVADIKFTPPNGFECIQNDNDALAFENKSTGASIRLGLFDADGYSFNEFYENIEDIVPLSNIINKDVFEVNGVPFIVLTYEETYGIHSICGKYIALVDETTDTQYMINYYVVRELTEEDNDCIAELISNISAPKLAGGAENTNEDEAESQDAEATDNRKKSETLQNGEPAAPELQDNTLRKGDEGENVTKLQKRLVKLGYLDIDVISGKFGEAEEAAVREFQIASGLDATGEADAETLKQLNSPKATKAQRYATLQKGDKNDAVKRLQARLKELGYLDGSADGDYGKKTKDAVARFQSDAGLHNDGIADNATQKALFADDAPRSKTYQQLNFKALSRDPDRYMDEYYVFSGEVNEVLEASQDDGTTVVQMRIATKDWYDDVVLVGYVRGKSESRILEDDKVTVYGQYKGLETYEAIFGNSVTIPLFIADQISLR